MVDDGSTDDTDEWLQLHHPSIKLISQSNCGVSSARNLGIQHAQTDWISLLDSDDEWLPKKLDRQLDLINHSNNEYRLIHKHSHQIHY